MYIYHFDDLGVFYAKSIADQSPLEPGVFLIPAKSTTLPPPQTPPGYKAVFIADSWQVIPDGLDEGSQPDESIDDLKAARNNYINMERAKANAGTFGHAGKDFACDALSRGDIDGVNGFVALTGNLPPGFPGAWKAVDNSYLPIPDVSAWTAFYGAMVAAGAEHFAHAQQLKEQLAAATTAEEVAAIVW